MAAVAVPDHLADRYDTSAWRFRCRRHELAENRYVLALLDAALSPEERRWAADGRSLDVGAKNWAYFAAQRSAVPGPWHAVELTGGERHKSFLTREGVARRRLRGLPSCRFVTGDVRDLRGPYRLVTWFLPFVTPGPLRAWGLDEAEHFGPDELLDHVWCLLEPGGVLLVSNQGAREAEIQGELFERHGIAAVALGPLAGQWSPFRHPRPVWRAVMD